MAIRTRMHSTNEEYVRLMRKADQAWEMGGLARQDGDTADMERQYAKAREYQAQANAIVRAEQGG